MVHKRTRQRIEIEARPWLVRQWAYLPKPTRKYVSRAIMVVLVGYLILPLLWGYFQANDVCLWKARRSEAYFPAYKFGCWFGGYENEAYYRAKEVAPDKADRQWD